MTGAPPALVVDTSAVVAIIAGEAGADWLSSMLSEAERAVIPAGTYLELGMVLEARYSVAATGLAARFVRDAEIEIVEVTASVAERALEAWRRYGKGRRPAKLNFGDCLVYGTAAELQLPILCTGEDFARTEVPVLRPTPLAPQ
ncbi:type II toxin-antitoxin system VapC family toxin [Natronosporangium hydrolyticum]|uniref:Ribonuclease VapC n=1 Tax=Natronosporangium hydrolyticum TaxID=2811111 RepID=A0A895YAY4_9ACTN|nr:type II toxin-antitoxin system VapC family toxin [Natronosporangium hydrolyticum]QSB14934.1 type II toxin-antitoxin system VapC family toxin [Natronosporangium hydrolyticum]